MIRYVYVCDWMRGESVKSMALFRFLARTRWQRNVTSCEVAQRSTIDYAFRHGYAYVYNF